MIDFNTFINEKGNFLSFQDFKGKFKRFDLEVMQDNLGIPRAKMPQITANNVVSFKAYLAREHNVNMSKKTIELNKIKLTQKEINFSKVLGMMNDAPSSVLRKPVMVSRDYRLLDGHHRIAALMMQDGNSTIEAHMIDATIADVLEMAHGFDKVIYKGIKEKQEE